jgi:regulator of protease activity HflC (stomatin/prohibitin superfamily)
MEAYVYDTVRSEIPKMTLDQLFEAKTKIAKIIHNDLGEKMNDYGYEIVKALVIDIRPDPLVVASMNEIYASRQLKIVSEDIEMTLMNIHSLTHIQIYISKLVIGTMLL